MPTWLAVVGAFGVTLMLAAGISVLLTHIEVIFRHPILSLFLLGLALFVFAMMWPVEKS